MIMDSVFKSAVAALILTVGLAGSVVAGAFEDGTDAAESGDYETAMRLWRPLADQGDATVQNLVGQMYREGTGVPQDYAAAMGWYQKAADQGNAPAQFNLGFMYFNGLGVAQDYAAALSWYRRAADQGNTAAQLNLGVMYLQGEGAPKDYVSAYMWFNLAAAAIPAVEFPNVAAAYRDEVAEKMTSEQVAEAQRLAREWKPR
jgi:TPR repeat protein